MLTECVLGGVAPRWRRVVPAPAGRQGDVTHFTDLGVEGPLAEDLRTEQFAAARAFATSMWLAVDAPKRQPADVRETAATAAAPRLLQEVGPIVAELVKDIPKSRLLV